MSFAGKYSYLSETPAGKKETILSVREDFRGYQGEVIGSDGSCTLMSNVVVRGNTLSFDSQFGPCIHTVSITKEADGSFTGSEIVYKEDGEEVLAIEDIKYSPKKLRALILYATMTKNTEKIAIGMKEAFEYYKWEVNLFKMTMKKEDWAGQQENLYFDDYDVICLGSPIVAGYPLTVVNKVFSLGAGGALESQVQKQVDAGDGFKANADTIKPPPGADGPDGPGAPPPKTIGAMWRRRLCPYPGGPSADNFQPLGIVFTTYGGGFFGSNEALATLSALKLFLELNNVSVIGQFACCGKEFGPAGLEPMEKPMLMGPGELPDPKIYEVGDGEEYISSYFFHGQPWAHPTDRDAMKAKALVSDLVEDMFLTYDGKRAQVESQYITIS